MSPVKSKSGGANKFLMVTLTALICLGIGFGAGVCLAPQLNLTQLNSWMRSAMQAVSGQPPTDENSPFEMYDYPTIKWRPKPVAGVEGAIAQLWTTYETRGEGGKSGKINYRLTTFKAPNKMDYEVQLLDKNGFKLMQFNATDFHQIPGSSEILEARDSYVCDEDEYRRVQDYSIK